MSYPYSDEESTDSDSGIRFKTTNTRHHQHAVVDKSFDSRVRGETRRRYRSRSRSRSRSKSRKDYRRNRHRSRTPDKYEKHHRKHSSRTSSDKYERRKEVEEYRPKTNSDKYERRKDVEEKTISVKYERRKDVDEYGSKTNSDKYEHKKEVVDEYGPRLPPKKKESTSTSSTSSTSSTPSSSTNSIQKEKDDEFIGPALPPTMNKPAQPKPEPEPENKNVSSSEEDVYGPTLPPSTPKPPEIKAQHTRVIGPTLPPNIKLSSPISSTSQINTDSEVSDDDFVGPVPAGHSTTNPNLIKLEERALEIKLNGLNKPDSDTKVREEWMLELPDVHTANLGLGPRQFRAKGVPDMSDRSSWTDTPQDKQNKAKNKHKSSSTKHDIKKEAELEHLKKRDLEQQQIVEKHKKKKKRDKSLLDIHQEKINKKKKEENKDQVRRPFSRDIDLKANRFDEAQKKSILKKAQLLDNRFSSGESKFL